jgi:PAS domain S-box-containing protein
VIRRSGLAEHGRVDVELPALMGKAGLPVAVMDEAGVLTWMSPALESLLGVSTPDCPGAGWTLYGEFGNVRLGYEDLPLVLACRRGQPYDAIVTMTMPDGSVRHHHWNARPLFAQSGEQSGAMAVITDLTGWAEAARRCLDVDLATTVSHQIRTPLTSILAQAELIGDCTACPAEAGRAAFSIQRAVHRLEAVTAWLCGQLVARGGGGAGDTPE